MAAIAVMDHVQIWTYRWHLYANKYRITQYGMPGADKTKTEPGSLGLLLLRLAGTSWASL